MAQNYKAVTWTKQKKIYDVALLSLIVLFFAVFGLVHFTQFPQVQPQILIIRSTAFLAFILLHLILWIGPLSRINSAFLILLYNRRHLGVVMFFIALIHGAFSIIYFHGFGNENPIISVFTSNLQYLSFNQFPFQVLGFTSLLILFLMAATSHDFWLRNLSPKVWKRLHMMVYLAYIGMVFHILLGYSQSNHSTVANTIFVIAFGATGLLHLIAAIVSHRKTKKYRTDAIEIKDYDTIKNDRARIINCNNKSIAIFRIGENFAAVSNECKHQQGPLGEGRIVDGCITCPWHGYQYKPEDGCSPPPYDEKVATYNLKFEGERLWLSLTPNPEGTSVELASVNTREANQKQKPFYIGWSENQPKSLQRKSLVLYSFLAAIFISMGYFLASSQENYKESAYTYGKLEEFEGIYVNDNAPMLQLSQNGIIEDIMLVDFGKFSATRSIISYEEKNGVNLSGKEIRIKGTIIQYNGKSLIELAQKEKSILSVNEETLPVISERVKGAISLKGEIVDPKCYFGVMNPAEGKIHKSCAIRCISGGIPPILRVFSNKGEEYYILKSDSEFDLNQQILPFVGEEVKLSGIASSINNWNYLTLTGLADIQRLSFRRYLGTDDTSTLCYQIN